jgi:Flp pilus assembly protein TadD
LIPRLAPTAVEATAGSPPQSVEAYDLYLRSLAVSHDARANRQAIPMLERAVALDPNYAPAWQELGQRLYFSGHAGGGDPDLDRSDSATQRALALNPNFPDAARSLTVSRTERGDLEGAYDAAQDFLDRRPNDAQAHGSMGYVLRYAGLINDSVREYETALKLDPTNYILRSGALSILQTGDYARAHEFLRVDAGSEWAYGGHAGIFLREGKYEEAKDAYGHSAAREAEMILAHLDHHPLAEVEADAAKAEANVLAIRDPEDRSGMADALSFCGLNERALRMMRLAVEGNYLAYPAMDRDPLLANVRGTPEFAAIRALAIQKQNQFLAHRAERERKSVISRN